MRGLALATCGVIACSSSSGTTQQGDCALMVSVSGGNQYASGKGMLGCGSVGPDGYELDVSVYGPGSDYHELAMVFSPPLTDGQLGTVTATVTWTADDASTGMRSSWKSAIGDCTIDITKDVHMPDSFFMNKYIIAGDGSCANALAPVSPNTLPSVNLEPFTFQSFDNPMM